MVGLLGGDDRRVGGEHEVDSGVGHEVGLEFCHIHIQGAVKSQGGSQRGDDLGDEPVAGASCSVNYTKHGVWGS